MIHYYTITFFNGLYDNVPRDTVGVTAWTDFVEIMKGAHKLPGEKIPDMLQISPAVYKEGTTRANKNVECWGGWAAIDVDCDLPEDFESYIREIAKPYRFYAYSTGSSTREKPKMRIMLPLDERPEGDRIKHLWYALQKHFRELGDEQTKDASRMYYPPAQYKNSFVFEFEELDGENVCVSELIAKYPYTEPSVGFAGKFPEEIQQRFIAYRKNQLNNTDIRWSSYHDCPFFPKKLAREYSQLTEGWYHHIYRMMVAIASSAIDKGYPITAKQIETLIRAFDKDNGGWYEKRPIAVEANRALEYALYN
jgi:hypothetical protein